MQDESQRHPLEKLWVNLAAERLGARALFATDEFFAPAENLLKPGRGIFIEDKYTTRGKWMDGWESRRKRESGHDHCIVQLGLPGLVHGLDIDTNHFTGNHPPFASVEAANTTDPLSLSTAWKEILPKSPLEPGSHNYFEMDHAKHWTHLRLNIFPDGGVARFKVYGEVKFDWAGAAQDTPIDLAAMTHGGQVVVCSDMYFSHRSNLILPGPVRHMGDGWETRRRRGPGHDWAIVTLGHAGVCEHIEIDTSFFKGNFPDTCQVEGIHLAEGQREGLENPSLHWQELLPSQKLQAHRRHKFTHEVVDLGPITHVRLNIYPDGGVGRLRIWGRPV